MSQSPFINQSKNEFVDISSEEFRTYRFPGDEYVKIFNPIHLSVGPSGHRLFDSSGQSHFIPKGWIQLSWRAKEGKPNFVK